MLQAGKEVEANGRGMIPLEKHSRISEIQDISQIKHKDSVEHYKKFPSTILPPLTGLEYSKSEL